MRDECACRRPSSSEIIHDLERILAKQSNLFKMLEATATLAADSDGDIRQAIWPGVFTIADDLNKQHDDIRNMLEELFEHTTARKRQIQARDDHHLPRQRVPGDHGARATRPPYGAPIRIAMVPLRVARRVA